jgi:hypothetical protein
MNEPIDFEPLRSTGMYDREDRVVRAALERIAGRADPATGLLAGILGVSRIALPACIVVAVIALIAIREPLDVAPSSMSAARALGVSYALEQLIRQPEPPSIEEMLTAFGSPR